MTLIARPTHLALTLLAMLFALPSHAQPLIEHVPDNAAIYIGWRGTTDMGPDYKGSNLEGVIEETGLLQAIPQLMETLSQIAKDAEQENGPPVGMLVNMGGELWSQLWANGGALYMLPPAENGPPIPRLALVWANAKDNDKLRGSLEELVKMINSMEQLPVFLSESGNALVLSAGFQAGAREFQSLGKTERFTSAAKQIQSDGAMVVYVDVQEWITQVDGVAKMMQQRAAEWGEKDPFAEVWTKLKDVSGLTGVKRLMMTAGIENKNWHTRVFLDAPAPRKGILALMDNKAITPGNLQHVPKSATYLQVFSMDPGKVMDTVRTMVGTVDPGMVRQMDNGLADTNKMLGFDIEKQLVKGMGPVWSVYIDPMIAGNSFSSMVIVNQLSDPKAVQDALTKLGATANKELDKNLAQGPIKVRFLERKVDGQTIHYLGVPYVAPAWMIKDDRLYMALYPQALEMAAGQSGKIDDSILMNKAYQKAVGRYGGKSYTGVSFVDLPETAPDGYGFNLMMLQTLTGASEMFSGKASTMRLPPVGKLMPYVEPSGSLTWVDADGVHMHGIEPFPSSSLLGPAKGFESVMALSVPIGVGVMLPALGSAREAARQTQTLSQARQVAMAAMAYSFDENKYPQDINDIMPEYLNDPSLLIAGNSTRMKALPAGFAEWEPARKEAFLRVNSSFVFVPLAGPNDIKEPSKTIMLFQRPDDAGDQPLAVVWADGHATSEKHHAKVQAMLEAQTGQTMQKLIQRQEQFGQ